MSDPARDTWEKRFPHGRTVLLAFLASVLTAIVAPIEAFAHGVAVGDAGYLREAWRYFLTACWRSLRNGETLSGATGEERRAAQEAKHDASWLAN